MPANDGNTAVWYMILDENDGEIAFEHQNLHYDFGLTSSLMLDNGLQKNTTILSGIWDNMEILPKQKFNNKDNKFNFKMNKNLILIFTRNPELRKVKTFSCLYRNQNALEIYIQLLEHTKSGFRNALR
jgi:hypothetical protein